MIDTLFFSLTCILHHPNNSALNQYGKLNAVESMRQRLLNIGVEINYESLLEGFHLPFTKQRKRLKESTKHIALSDLLISAIGKDDLTQYDIEQALAAYFASEHFNAYAAPGAHEVLQQLSLNYQCVLIANSDFPGYCQDMLLERLALKKYFKRRIYSYDIGIRKPHRGLFWESLRRVGSKSEKTLVIGDSDMRDIQPALEMGFRAIPFSPFRQPESVVSQFEFVFSWPQLMKHIDEGKYITP